MRLRDCAIAHRKRGRPRDVRAPACENPAITHSNPGIIEINAIRPCGARRAKAGQGTRRRQDGHVSLEIPTSVDIVVVYGNQLDASAGGTPLEGTAINAGNIVVHTAKN